MGEVVYCENAECRVEVYHVGDEEADKAKHYLERDPVGPKNCPGCGRFGRTKGDQ
jgi:hypothetical protein